MRGFSKLENVSATPRDGFALSNLLFKIFNLFGVTRDDAGVTPVSIVSADTLESRTQGGRIASLFGRLRTRDHAVLATTSGTVVRTGALLGTTLALVVAFLALVLAVAAPAQADFGLSEFDVSFENEDGTSETQAGAHPFAVTTAFEINTEQPINGSVAKFPKSF